MDTHKHTPPQYVSKKRVFPVDVEVLEIPPPYKTVKQHKVICQEIIYVDLEEDCNDVTSINGTAEISGKGKEKLFNASLNLGMSAKRGPINGVQSLKKNCPSASDNPIIIDDEHDDLWMPGLGGEKWVSTSTSTSGRESSLGTSHAKRSRRKFSSSHGTGSHVCDNQSTLGSPSIPRGPAPNPEQQKVLDGIQKFRLFKKFDTVTDHSDHHYSRKASPGNQPSKSWAKKIQEEWKILEKDLPDTIFVRVYETRMDLLRAVIMGADGTPYHGGLFFFDVLFPSNYPKVPPQVHYHSFGLRINPNLYNCGKVCLSLLNTWSGSGKEKWIPSASTMLQVLVSIQGLILNAKPYFNEPGYASSSGTVKGEEFSLQYTENTYILNLKTMVFSMRRPPKYFEDFVLGHFLGSAHDILVACKAYMDGAQVGSLVRGGVQDVDEGDKSCSQNFKTSLAGYMKTLVDAFKKIGVQDCDKFLHVAARGTCVVP